jgi:hypothetical protein
MSAKIGSKGLLSKLQKTLMVAVALVVLMASLPVRQAYAWSLVNPQGNVPIVYTHTIDLTGGSNAGGVVTRVWGRGPQMPSNNTLWGNYFVTVQYQLEKLVMGTDGRATWAMIASIVHTVPVSLATGPMVFLPDVDFQIGWNYPGIFRVTDKIWWHNSAGTFAYTAVVPNLTSDFMCQHGLLFGRPCQVGPGWFILL